MLGGCFLSCSGFIAVLGNPGTQTGTVTNGNTATKTTMHHGPLGSMCKFKDLRGLYYRVTTGALIIKIGFGAHHTTLIIRNPKIVSVIT